MLGEICQFHLVQNSHSFSLIIVKTFVWTNQELIMIRRKFCFFVVFTVKDVFVQKFDIDREYVTGFLLPKLHTFYVQHFRPFVASLLWGNKMNRCTLDIPDIFLCVLNVVHHRANLSTITFLKFIRVKQRQFCLQEAICCLEVHSSIFLNFYSSLSLVLHESVLMPSTYLSLFPLAQTGLYPLAWYMYM